jgi:hypothetical protein
MSRADEARVASESSALSSVSPCEPTAFCEPSAKQKTTKRAFSHRHRRHQHRHGRSGRRVEHGELVRQIVGQDALFLLSVCAHALQRAPIVRKVVLDGGRVEFHVVEPNDKVQESGQLLGEGLREER